MTAKDMHADEVSIDTIRFDPRNANKGTKRGSETVEQSISDFGFIDPGILDKDNMLIGGNKRTKAASDVGHKNAIIIDHDGKTPIYIRYPDFDLDSPDADIREKSRRLAYMLNRSAQISLSWDTAQLEDDIASGLDLSGMFTPEEAEKLIVKAKALPPVTDQEEPTLVSEHYVQLYCSAEDLSFFMQTLEEWMQRPGVTVNIA